MKFAPEAVGIGPALAWLRLAPRGATSWARPLPDFLVIGAKRSGTSSFYDHLARHPRIAAARVKEGHIFDYRWHLGTAWYRSFFPLKRSLPPGSVTGEATPYYLFHPAVPARVAEALPGARLIAFLRDPVERGFSHWRRQREKGVETLSFEDALDAEEERLADEHERLAARPRYRSVPHQAFSYKARGLYADQLERWIERFDRRSILVLRSEELFADPARVVAKALRFLGLRERDLGPLPHRSRGTASPLRPHTREALRAYFEPHDRRLCRLLGWESAW